MHSRNTCALSALALAASTFLVACGGGGDDPANPPETAREVSGTVLDRGLNNATVCLDLNDNRACDAGEPSALTSNGSFTITTTQAADAIVLVQASTASTTTEGPVVAPYVLTAPLGRHAVISPYTTLLQSELDAGRSDNVAQAEDTLLSFLVGTAGQVGGIQLYDDYRAAADATPSTAQQKMLALGELLTRGFADTSAGVGGGSRAAFEAYGAVAPGSLQQLLYQIPATLTPAQRESLYLATRDSMVPSAATLAGVAKAEAATAAQPIEGAWVRTDGTTREVFLFGGDGSFVHQVIATPVGANYAFDNGLGYRYGRYSLSGSTLTLELLEAANARGPAAGAHTATVSGNAMTLDGTSLTRVASAGNALVGGWVRPMGLSRPEYMVVFEDGTYAHSTFYYQNDRQTGTATALETARNVGVQLGTYAARTAPGTTDVIDFGETTVDFNGNLSVPSNPGVAHVQSDGSISLSGLRLVKLGTTLGAKAVTGFSEATRSRIWSGRYFSLTQGTGAGQTVQYLYVKGPGTVVAFDRPATVSTAACVTKAAPFTNIDPSDGILKQLVLGTGTTGTAYAQRRMVYGTPASFVTMVPTARPTDATARCTVPF